MLVSIGKLVSFDSSRGFGFIRPEDGGPDVFVHVNDIGLDEDELRQGRVFEFDVTEGDRGPKAINLALVGGTGPVRHKNKERGERTAGQLSAEEHRRLITELLLDASPALTAGEILTIRERLTAFADQHGWIDG
ncbi:cold shock domain-containing protein [Nocardia otitidiscaviarum]|uniref:Cold shock domain-containing protein n=1 Tax=Nocardia otitidiscaviarum TaxID=1823 RepID=A0A516NLE6_9NOCA|nr:MULTISPECIES: cold shock domain-containing protein [Nocardia]MBF6137492.1 cold shock domain-containing protein [Nocardia otitidiscaviarum]MBF6182105.1 cold shock domain-containing protein [Nocardia otitidiscaviarum]MBF6488246.1 cold shock domain-containing protein [Nocardia otitidiscaviarum]MCP9619234.1 cold shock domain-containing protein [Nocardia otitidiscaviarum]QDP79705.1 cold shock domain-containing protein [Nocardia otitidiscaviarum]